MAELRPGRKVSRRTVIASCAAAAGAALVLAGRGLYGVLTGDEPTTALQAAPAGLPESQHAWEAYLATDADGNTVMPRFHRLLFFDLTGKPDANSVRHLEASLRSIETRYAWDSEGLLFTMGWGPDYFERWTGGEVTLDQPRRLTSFETPELDSYAACLHIASDDEEVLSAVENALLSGVGEDPATSILSMPAILRWRETRTGFVGAGLAAERMSNPQIPKDAPLAMGFKSGFRRNQATEEDVTIPNGPMAGGTTMHVNPMRVRLDSWFRLLDEQQRVARMFAPQFSAGMVRDISDEAATFSDALDDTARNRGVVGHLQAVGKARRDGRPIILRRDFDTIDGGEPGLHFLSLQRTIGDFEATQAAMNAAHLPFINSAIQPRENNGINEFVFVLRRGNYIIPPRPQRSFPLLPGRDKALLI